MPRRDRSAIHRCIKSSYARRLRVEALEDRRLLAVLTVQNNLDDTLANLAGDGELSLREAIEIANNPGLVIDGFVSNDVEDTIEFARPYFDHPRTILLEDGELEITQTLTIDGTGKEFLTIDGSANDPTPNEDNGDGSRLLNINFVEDSPGTRVVVSSLTLTGGDVSGSGGAIQSIVDLSLHDVIVQSNAASDRGGGIAIDGNLSLQESTISGNRTTGTRGFGGGIYLGIGSLEMTYSTVSHNRTTNGPGGGLLTFSGTVSISSSAVIGNETNGGFSNGGGIYSGSGALDIVNSTISENLVTGDFSLGGGIYKWYGNASIVQSTISDNSSLKSAGGGFYTGNFTAISIVSVRGSIFANNLDAGYSPDLALGGSNVTEFNYNLVGDITGTDIDGTSGVGNLLNVDPLLGPLGDNGGPTFTHALLPGSPAIDAGDPTIPFDLNEFDQRGAPFLRVADGNLPNDIAIDIGAYEAQSVASADFDADGDVDGRDFLTWQRGFGMTGALRADGNSDDDTDVDASDLAAWRVSYGAGAAVVSGQALGASYWDVGENLAAVASAWEFLDDEPAGEGQGGFDDSVVPEVVVRPVGVSRALHSAERRSAYREAIDAERTLEATEPWLSDELLEGVFG